MILPLYLVDETDEIEAGQHIHRVNSCTSNKNTHNNQSPAFNNVFPVLLNDQTPLCKPSQTVDFLLDEQLAGGVLQSTCQSFRAIRWYNHAI